MDMNYEQDFIMDALKNVSGYLDCEKIIVWQIRKHVTKGLDDPAIETYLKNIASHLEAMTETCVDANIQMNYRYVIGFVNTLLRTPSWRNWMQAIQV